MTMIVETGEGVSGANSYVGLAFALEYLETRNSAVSWAASSLAIREAALIEATQYVDITFGHRFLGVREFTALAKFARNFISLEGQALNNDTLTIGSQTYTFVNSVTTADEIHIGATLPETLLNIVYAVNASGGTVGTDWGTGTVANTDVTAAISDSGNEVILTARESGVAANSIAVTTDDPDNINIDAPTLTGGSAPGTQPLEFPRNYLYDRSGILVDGIPEKLKMAVTEYASRAISASLLPDPTYDDSGRIITQKLEKIGPIEEETTYLAGALTITRKYPFADRMLKEYLAGAGGVIR